jgi:intermembrane space import and assembly protein 40
VFAESPKCRSRKQFVGDADLNVLIEIVSQKSLADNAEEPEPPTIESISPKHRNVSRPSIAGQDGESASTEHKSILKESEEGEGLSDDVQELEDEAGSEGAFNPETGEINWDCPCLGGMAHGPCGEEFKAAFSCFVYSKDEPKGIDCIDKFK